MSEEYLSNTSQAYLNLLPEAAVDTTLERLKVEFENILNEKLQGLEHKLLAELFHIHSDLQLHLHSSDLFAEVPEAPGHASKDGHQTETPPSVGIAVRVSDVDLTLTLNSCEEADGQKSSTRLSEPKKVLGIRILKPERLENMHAPRAASDKASTCANGIDEKMVLGNYLTGIRRRKALCGKRTSLATWWHHLQEPQRSGFLAALVTSRWFEFFCILAIFVSTAFLAMGAEWEIQHIGDSDSKSNIFTIADYACSMFFLLELCMRLSVHRSYFFINNEMIMNCFDFVVIVLSSVDLMLLVILRESDMAKRNNVILARWLRLIKWAKMFRTVRVLRFFRDIHVIIETVTKSMVTLMWTVTMLGILLFIFSLIFLHAIIDYVDQQEDLGPEEIKMISKYFGSIWLSMLSLLCAITGGNDWQVYYDIIASTGPYYSVVFVAFTLFCKLSLFNILIGLFTDKVTGVLRSHTKEAIVSRMKATASLMDPSQHESEFGVSQEDEDSLAMTSNPAQKTKESLINILPSSCSRSPIILSL